MSRTFPGHAWVEKCAKEKKMHVLQKNVKVLKKQLLDKRQCTSQGFEIVININLFDPNSELCIKRPQTCMTGAALEVGPCRCFTDAPCRCTLQ